MAHAILAGSVLAFVTASATTQKPVSVIPYPQRVEFAAGAPFEFRSTTSLRDRSASKAGSVLAAMLLRAGGPRLGSAETGSGANRVVFAQASVRDRLSPGGYRLAVSKDEIRVEFSDEAGAFYAVQTLRQLLPSQIESQRAVSGVRWTVPAVRIEDWPRFSWRGMHLDVSRHFFSPEFIKRYIDYLALHKLNVFHWHLVDDGGWRMEVEKYPKLTEVGAWRVDTGGDWPGGEWNQGNLRFPGQSSGKKLYGGYYTRAQIREIVRYAAERHITIVPEIEMPGHALPALVAYPEVGCDNVPAPNEPGHGPTNVFCVGKESTFAFLEDVLRETMELFPSKWIHIGADEVWKGHWQRCPRCQERIRSLGLTAGPHSPEENLQSYFVRRMEGFLWRSGRRLIGWDEILEGGLAPGSTVMSWRGISGGIAAAKAGHEVVMSPTSHCYFDYPYVTTSTKHVYGWDPVPGELSAEEGKLVLGGQANVWTEWIATEDRVEYMVFPRMLATAEVLWLMPETKSWDSFSARQAAYFARLDLLGVDYHLPSPEVESGAVLFESAAEVAAKRDPSMPFTLRYTLDGSLPTTSSPAYESPIRVSDSCLVTFAYVSGQGKSGDVARVECRKFSPRASSEGLSPGLWAECFEGSWQTVPSFEGLTPANSGAATEIGVGFRTRDDNFALRFRGFVKIEREGVYTYSLGSDDGSALWIGGAKLIDNDGLHGHVEKSASIRLKPGLYPIDLAMFELGGAESLTLAWEGPGVERSPLPAANLFRELRP